VRRRDRRRQRNFTGKSFRKSKRSSKIIWRSKNATVADTLDGDEPRLHAFSKHHAGTNANRTKKNPRKKANTNTKTKTRRSGFGKSNQTRAEKPKKNAGRARFVQRLEQLDDDEGEPDDLQGAEAWTHNEMPEQPLEAGDTAFAYDEWDRDLAITAPAGAASSRKKSGRATAISSNSRARAIAA
jgi:hypothetical protein